MIVEPELVRGERASGLLTMPSAVLLTLMLKKRPSLSPKHPSLSPKRVEDFIESLFEDDLHAKRIRSLADGTVGILKAGSLGIHAIGRGLAAARGLNDKHAVKQVDRLLGNAGIDVWQRFESWIPHVLGDRKDVLVNFDWTEFEPDDQCMIVASIQTAHARSTPLAWLTVVRSRLLERLRQVIPEDVHVTIVADRGFADRKLYSFLKDDLGFDFIIRFRSVIHVTNEAGETRSARDWLGSTGRMRVFRKGSVTADHHPVATVVCVRAKDMKEPWCLASSLDRALGADLVKRYGKRFTIEEMFRDVKDLRFGMGMGWRKIGTPERRDRMFLMAALAQGLLTLLGEAGERTGLDRVLKTNTSKERQLSLMRQGLLWYERIPTMPEARLNTLMREFGSMLLEHRAYQLSLGLE
jgi:hypothetical protein